MSLKAPNALSPSRTDADKHDVFRHGPSVVVHLKEKEDLFSRLMLPFVLVIFTLRGIITAKFPLLGDEAYYWLWAKHLSLGYHDHPPLIAWLIAATTAFW